MEAGGQLGSAIMVVHERKKTTFGLRGGSWDGWKSPNSRCFKVGQPEHEDELKENKKRKCG